MEAAAAARVSERTTCKVWAVELRFACVPGGTRLGAPGKLRVHGTRQRRPSAARLSRLAGGRPGGADLASRPAGHLVSGAALPRRAESRGRPSGSAPMVSVDPEHLALDLEPEVGDRVADVANRRRIPLGPSYAPSIAATGDSSRTSRVQWDR